MKKLRKIFKLLTWLLALAIPLFYCTTHTHIWSGIVWYRNLFVYVAAEDKDLRLVFNRDTARHPLSQSLPFIKIWKYEPDPYDENSRSSASGSIEDRLDTLSYDDKAPSTKWDWAGIHLTTGTRTDLHRYELDLDQHAILLLPWWLPLSACGLFALLQGLAFFRKWRRNLFKSGHCPACGYDLRSTTARCPECGRPFTEPERNRRPVHDRFRRSDLHIRRHALGIVSLTATAAVVVLLATWPAKPVVALIDTNKRFASSAEDDSPVGIPASPDKVWVQYNVIDLCVKDKNDEPTLPIPMAKEIIRRAGPTAGSPEGFALEDSWFLNDSDSHSGTVISGYLYLDHARKLAEAINYFREKSHE